MPTATHAFNCGSGFGVLDPIDEVSGAAGSTREQWASSRPVVVEGWAEGLISPRLTEPQPKNPLHREPAREKNGASAPAE